MPAFVLCLRRGEFHIGVVRDPVRKTYRLFADVIQADGPAYEACLLIPAKKH